MKSYKRFLVWTNYGGYEGWRQNQADTWIEAVALREDEVRRSCCEVLITEYCPLDIRDGRKDKTNALA